MSKAQSTEPESTPRQATYQDVLDAPPHKVAEIVDGKLYLFPRPAPTHAIANSAIGGLLNPPFQYGRGGPGGWWILNEPELHLGDHILVPDVGGWRKERMPNIPKTAYFSLAPDWVCEVLSPSTRNLDLGRKRAIYAQQGVKYLWLIDPNSQSLEAFQLRNASWELISTLSGDNTVCLPPFEEIDFNLSDLWPPPTVHKASPAESMTAS